MVTFKSTVAGFRAGFMIWRSSSPEITAAPTIKNRISAKIPEATLAKAVVG